MARYADRFRDTLTGAPIEGALVYVTDYTGALATLTDDHGDPMDNPFLTDQFGTVLFHAADGRYTLTYRYGSREVFSEVVTVGTLIANMDPDPSNANKYLSLDANGNAIYSSGTGADDGLRTDLGDPVGAVILGPLAGNRAGRVSPNASLDWATDLVPIVANRGPGAVVPGVDIRDLFDSLYPRAGISSGTIEIWVDPVNGSDSNDGSNVANAIATLDKARTMLGGTVWLMPGRYTADSSLYIDAFGNRSRRYIAPYGGVTLYWPGDVVSGLTFTASGTYSGCWEATVGTSNDVIRLLRTDATDAQGLPMPVPYRASGAAVAATPTYGWWFDTASNKLVIRNGAVDPNTTFKANLQAIYAEPTTAGRVLFRSVTNYWEGVTFEGCFINVETQSGQARGESWFKNCRFNYAPSNAITINGTTVITQGCFAYRCAADGMNYNNSVGQTAKGIEIDYQSFKVGDEDSYPGQVSNPVGTDYNKQASSNHDGIVVRINGYHDQSAGPLIQDTAGSINWIMGTRFGRSLAPAGSGFGYGILMQGNSSWLDGVDVPDSSEGAILSSLSAVLRTFNVLGTQATATSGTIVPYVPAAS